MGEAEEQSRMSKAEGEIESITALSPVMTSASGKDIMRVKLIQQYIEGLSTLQESSHVFTAPKESSEFSVLLNYMVNRNGSI